MDSVLRSAPCSASCTPRILSLFPTWCFTVSAETFFVTVRLIPVRSLCKAIFRDLLTNAIGISSTPIEARWPHVMEPPFAKSKPRLTDYPSQSTPLNSGASPAESTWFIMSLIDLNHRLEPTTQKRRITSKEPTRPFARQAGLCQFDQGVIP
jgi:hypothetical protein